MVTDTFQVSALWEDTLGPHLHLYGHIVPTMILLQWIHWPFPIVASDAVVHLCKQMDRWNEVSCTGALAFTNIISFVKSAVFLVGEGVSGIEAIAIKEFQSNQAGTSTLWCYIVSQWNHTVQHRKSGSAVPVAWTIGQSTPYSLHDSDWGQWGWSEGNSAAPAGGGRRRRPSPSEEELSAIEATFGSTPDSSQCLSITHMPCVRHCAPSPLAQVGTSGAKDYFLPLHCFLTDIRIGDPRFIFLLF